jgi:hypothetical protein
MTTPSAGGNGFRNRETGQGGADAVPDTAGVPAEGTEPNQPTTGSARGALGSSGGLGAAAWLVIIVLALVILLLYGGAVFG